ncbi:hypothetical protein QJS65_11125 [Bacillus altitudinis]|uniref:hypothetical protein n=1 Tax=Bacillus altitudinis TaxID=293387 RepID=UPI0024A955B4|nr:hypothetical protein [Bacillus altitudinis]WHF25397.1 hypothetical protein QJS65_11125 [Bacillus altitudinis]
MKKSFKFNKYGINIDMGLKINEDEPEIRKLKQLIRIEDGRSFRINKAYRTKTNEFMHAENDYILSFELDKMWLSVAPGDFKLKDDEGNLYPYYFTDKENEALLIDKETNKIHFDVKDQVEYYLIYSPKLGNEEIVIKIDDF